MASALAVWQAPLQRKAGSPLAVILGMALAFLLDAGIPLKSELRSCFLTPLMVPTASIVLIWQVLFDYNGVVNVAVQKFGGGQVDWLKSSAGLLVTHSLTY